MKTIEQYFSYNVQGDSNCFVWGLKSLNVTIHMKAIEQWVSERNWKNNRDALSLLGESM